MGVAQWGRETCRKKTAFMETLRGMGVPVPLRPEGFGKANALAALTRGGLFGSHKVGSRSRERNLLLSLPDDLRVLAFQQFDELEQLDKEEAENDAAMTEAVSPYVEAEMSGRLIYSDHRRAVAETAKDAGQPFIYEDLRELPFAFNASPAHQFGRLPTASGSMSMP